MPSRPFEFAELFAYNTRVSQGIIHTPEYVERMRLENERYNEDFRCHRPPYMTDAEWALAKESLA